MKVGLSLSGGAARGMIHIGAIEELTKSRIPIDIIAGCSIGSMIGALYALDPDVERTKQKILAFLKDHGNQIIPVEYIKDNKDERRGILRRIATNLRKSVFYGISLTTMSMMSGDKLRDNLAKLIPDVDFSECKIPFACATTDIVSNNLHYITEGSLLTAVTASCSIPGLYPPVEINGKRLVDGSWTAQNHIDQLRNMGAGFVIAVDILQDIKDDPEPSTGLDVVLRSNMATRNVLAGLQLKGADAVIQPDVCDISWWDFGSSEVCMIKGKEKTVEQVKEIKRKLRVAKMKNLFSW